MRYSDKDHLLYLRLYERLVDKGEFSFICESVRDAMNRKHQFYRYRQHMDAEARYCEENKLPFARGEMLHLFQETSVGIHTSSGPAPILRFYSRAADSEQMLQALADQSTPIADLDAIFLKMKQMREEAGVVQPDANKGGEGGKKEGTESGIDGLTGEDPPN